MIIIDAYQDKKNEIVILDIVAVNSKTRMYAFEFDDALKDLNEENAASSLEKRVFRRFDCFFAHVKDRNRINVDLTRARSCLIIIVQMEEALWTSRSRNIANKKQLSDLTALMEYAIREDIIYTDTSSKDDHLDALQARLHLQSPRDKEYKASYDLAFIRERISMGHRGQGGYHSQSG